MNAPEKKPDPNKPSNPEKTADEGATKTERPGDEHEADDDEKKVRTAQ